MNSISEKYDVVIVGGGPVGLFLGLCLQEIGVSHIILEKRLRPHPGSRSLGVHPISLELFQELNIAHRFIKKGIKIKRGHAFANKKKLGSLSFENCAKPYNFILALPQYQTELLLDDALTKQNPDSLSRGTEVQKITEAFDHVKITFQQGDETKTIRSQYLVGCDGKDSFVRNKANISFKGLHYPDTYIMGDFSDDTDFGNDAAIFLCDDGLIESFPLPDNRRRWVVKTSKYIAKPSTEMISSKIFNRILYSLDGIENFMLSSFGVQKLMAKPMVSNRIILCGDAAHVVSPIGGQGMNLGWLAARDLAETLHEILGEPGWANSMLNLYQKRRTYAAKNAMLRAELNMRLGRKTAFPNLRNKLVSLMLNTPLSEVMANVFTMRGVE